MNTRSEEFLEYIMAKCNLTLNSPQPHVCLKEDIQRSGWHLVKASRKTWQLEAQLSKVPLRLWLGLCPSNLFSVSWRPSSPYPTTATSCPLVAPKGPDVAAVLATDLLGEPLPALCWPRGGKPPLLMFYDTFFAPEMETSPPSLLWIPEDLR
jgi:hypothetical protein